jgi:prepilin-type N-terminal cleavage/methylation domain-containing protein
MVAARRGFTLIELTIAIVLLAIGLLALTGALAQALRASTHARAAHAALRDADGIADSLAAGAGAAEAGMRQYDGYRIVWAPVGCITSACVRVTAELPRDTIALVAALRGTAR